MASTMYDMRKVHEKGEYEMNGIPKVRLIMAPNKALIALLVTWAVIIGAILGFWYSGKQIEQRLTDATTHKAIKIDGVEYDLKAREKL
jgi:hypothetical protein